MRLVNYRRTTQKTHFNGGLGFVRIRGGSNLSTAVTLINKEE